MMINILQVLEILNLELVVGKHLASHDSDMPYLQQEVKQNKQEGKLRNHLLFEKINSRHIKKGFVSNNYISMLYEMDHDFHQKKAIALYKI